jgi:NADH:ubiquinone oxidoreductase subunit E
LQGNKPSSPNFLVITFYSSQVLEENNLADQIKVEGCDCQGECGYGPNILLDGKIVNDVRGKDAVIKMLGIIELV